MKKLDPGVALWVFYLGAALFAGAKVFGGWPDNLYWQVALWGWFVLILLGVGIDVLFAIHDRLIEIKSELESGREK